MKQKGSGTSWRWIGLGVIAAVAPAVGLFAADYPFLSRLPGGTWLFVNADCPGSVQAFLAIRASPDLRREILIVPSDLESGPVRELACNTFQEQLVERKNWLALLPGGMLCEIVAQESSRFSELNFIISPAWAVDMVPASADWTPMLGDKGL